MSSQYLYTISEEAVVAFVKPVENFTIFSITHNTNLWSMYAQ